MSAISCGGLRRKSQVSRSKRGGRIGISWTLRQRAGQTFPLRHNISDPNSWKRTIPIRRSLALNRTDLHNETICKARHQVVFTKLVANAASGSDVPVYDSTAIVGSLIYSCRRQVVVSWLSSAISGRSRLPYFWYIFANFPMAAYTDLWLDSTAVFLDFLCFLLNRPISRKPSSTWPGVQRGSVHSGSTLCIMDKASLLNIQFP